MHEDTQADPRFPIGRSRLPERITPEHRAAWIGEIERLPRLMREAVEALPAERLDTPYRPGGWTVRQVVHHVPDSHMNAYVRFKLALTEEEPTIKAYAEAAWAELPDTRAVPVESALRLLELLHERWVALVRGLDDEQLRRGFWHPEQRRTVPLEQALGLYAWHGAHHLAHVRGVGGA